MKKLQFLRWPKFVKSNNRAKRCLPMGLFLIGLFLTVLTAKENAQTGSHALEKDQTAKLRKDLVEAVDPVKRADAARLLAQSGDKRSTKLLMRSTEDPDAEVRVQAILALGQLRARNAVPALIEILRTKNDLREKSASAFSLGIIRDRRAVEPLIVELRIAGPQLQQNIVVALGLLGDPRAVEPLFGLHHDENHETCAPIAIALGQIKSRVPADKLFEWLNSDDVDVCPNAAITLVLIGGKRQVVPLIEVLLSKNPVSRRSAAFALGTLKDRRAVVPLIANLQDTDVRVRLNVISALVLLKDQRSIEPLQNTAKSDSEIRVRESAAEAIKAIQGDPKK